MILADFNFSISHIKKPPAVHLNTSKALMPLQSKEKLIKILLAFIILIF